MAYQRRVSGTGATTTANSTPLGTPTSQNRLAARLLCRARLALRLTSGRQESDRCELSAERRGRRHVPPALEHGRIHAAEIKRVAGVAIAAQPVERWWLAVESARHPAA